MLRAVLAFLLLAFAALPAKASYQAPATTVVSLKSVGLPLAGGADNTTLINSLAASLLPATFTGTASIAFSSATGNTTMTVTGTPGGALTLNTVVSGTGIPSGDVITGFISGTGEAGTYQLLYPATFTGTATFQPPATAAIYAPAAIYRHNGVILLNGVQMYGDGDATQFLSTDTSTANVAIEIEGNGAGVRDISTMTLWTGSRQTTLQNQAIAINGATNFRVENVTVNGSPAGCVFNFGGKNGNIDRNRCWNTLADSYHNTFGASDIRITNNYAYNSGDDGIAVVSYTGDGVLTQRISIIGNHIINGLGRGITVVGGMDVVAADNVLSQISDFCLYATGESGGSPTYGDTNIDFHDNNADGCATQVGANPGTNTDAAILVDGYSGETSNNIWVHHNVVTNAHNSGIVVGTGTTYSSTVRIEDNNVTAAASNTSPGASINGTTNPVISGNTFKAFGSDGIQIVLGTGYLTLDTNTFDAINSNSSGSWAINMNSPGFTAFEARGNRQINDGTTVTECYRMDGVAVAMIDANQCDNHTVEATGITSGYWLSPFGPNIYYSGSGALTGGTYATGANCSSSASPAVCAAAAAGSVAVPTGTNPTLVVDTTAVTANSQVLVSIDESLGTKLGVTCNTTISTLTTPVVTARSAGVSFTVEIGATVATNPACLSYSIVN